MHFALLTLVFSAQPSEASRLYQLGDFAHACPLFAKQAAAVPTDGEAWADLGLCEWKRGRREASIHASLLAFRLGDEKVRKSALFNLNLAGFRTWVPGGEKKNCATLKTRPEFDCKAAPLRACSQPDHAEGSGGASHWRRLSFGSNDAVELEDFSWPFESYCLMHVDWDPAVSAVIEPELEKCFHPDASAPLQCSDKVRERAWKAADSNPTSWPEAAAAIRAASAVCKARAKGSSRSCEVIAIDPCAQRLGLACVRTVDGERQQGTEISEVEFSRLTEPGVREGR